MDVLLGQVNNTLRQDWKGLVKRENKDKIVNEQLPFVRKTWWFQGEFKWNGSSQWKFSRKEVIPFKVLPFSHIYQNDWKSLHHLSALTICMEKPVIPARTKMEWFILVEIFWKRINTFRGLPFSRFHQVNKIFCTLCLVNQCQVSSWGEWWFVLTAAHSLSGVLQMAQL